MSFLSRLFGKGSPKSPASISEPRALTVADVRSRLIADYLCGPDISVILGDDPATFEVEHTHNGASVKIDVSYLTQQMNNADTQDSMKILERFRRTILANLEQLETKLDAKRIVIILRPQPYLDAVTAKMGEAVHRPFAGDLVQMLALDMTDSIHPLSVSSLKDAEIDVDAAWQRAAKVTRNRMGEITQKAYPDLGGLQTLTSNTDLASALLLGPLRKAPYTAALVQRNLVAVATSDDEGQLNALLGLVFNSLGTDEFYSDTVISFDGKDYTARRITRDGVGEPMAFSL